MHIEGHIKQRLKKSSGKKSKEELRLSMDYEEYEAKCKEIREANTSYLKLFERDIKQLSPKTVRKHLDNVDFYINEYLLREDALSMKEGISEINGYLGYYFISHCMWSTPAAIKSTAASIKKFYKCMLDHGFIEKAEYDDLCFTIKENMEYWQEECARFNDPDGEDPFDFW